MKNKGFTLVELLVVIVIIGIITVIATPMIRNIRETNEQKEYSNYVESMRYAAKLYVDSYEDDLFGHEESGCALIPYQELKERNLIKDIDVSGVSCASDETYVRVVKMGDKYGYAVSIGCGKVDENGVVTVTYKLPKEGVVSSDTCGVDADIQMSFETNITNPEAINFKVRAMKVTVISSTGVNAGPVIQYGFSDKRDGSVISGWNKLNLDPSSESSQKTQIENGETIRVTSSQIQTPEGQTGPFYLVLRIDRLQDVFGKNWAKEGASNYVYLGPYTLDNTPPDFNDSRVISSRTDYNALEPKLDLKASDSIAPTDQFKMCVSFDTDTCRKDKASLEAYEIYNPTKVLDKIKTALDGSMHKVFVTVTDPAYNYTTKEFSYELASVITYQGNGHTSGSTSQTICNNNVDCTLQTNGFARTGYHYTGWYTATSGGSKYGATTRLTRNITVYAQWVDDIKPTCSTSKVAGVGSEGGVTVRVTCSDEGSKCRVASQDYGGQKANQTYTVYDNAGNSGTCSVSISGYNCNPYQYVCGNYVCGSYACGSYACGTHACGTYQYECGSYVCGWYTCCSPAWGTGEISGQVSCSSCANYCKSYCTGTNYCTSYCTSYCNTYCDSYCTGYKTCYN